MAEGVLGGLLGGEAEGAEDGHEEGVVAAEALAIALAVDHAKQDDTVAEAAARFLRAQTEALTEQRVLRLRSLQSQARDSRLRSLGLHIRIGTQVAFSLIAAAAALGLLVMVMDAFSSRSVVVEPFDAPPALAGRGLTGKVVAGGVLDSLTRLQAATRTNAVQRNLANAWTSDIKVEVPQTGISIGDIVRMLKARFGHDLHIDGDLVQTETGGVTLTIRGDGVLPKTFTAAAGELDKLTTEAAEYVYGQSQPALYATYLMNAGRNAEAVAFAKAAYPRTSADDRPFVLNVWADASQNLGAPVSESATLYSESLRLKPDFWIGYNNLMNVDLLQGDEEGARRLAETMRRRAGGRPGRAPELYYQNDDLMTWNLLAWRAAVVADLKAHAGVGTLTTAGAVGIADIDARLHDTAAAELDLQTNQDAASDPTVAAMGHFVRGRLAAEAGDVAAAAREMEAFQAAFANPIVFSNYPGYNCWIAPAEEAAGRPDKADAVLKAGGHYIDCYRFRGDILDHRGDWAGAQQAYAQAVAIAPDLPGGHYSWGVALAKHGDLSGALNKLSAAHARGPHWADPLKVWGDVLARQGRWREALAKYDEALKDAPAWAALRQARDAAAHRAG